MSETYAGGCDGGAMRSETGHVAVFSVAGWLRLAAAPTFAIMAVLTGVLDDGPLDILCSTAEHTSRLSGMIPMYLLMSAFHSPPWLTLISGRRAVANL